MKHHKRIVNGKETNEICEGTIVYDEISGLYICSLCELEG